MKTENFNIEQGIYLTELYDLKSALHSHPACEIVYAEKGSFHLEINQAKFSHLKFAIIEANVLHSLTFENSKVKILMTEHRDLALKHLFTTYNLTINNGYFISAENMENELFNNLNSHVKDIVPYSHYDERVKQCLEILHHQRLTYENLKETIKWQIKISESRLSHIFKENTGVSIRRYFVWHKLKQAVDQHLHNDYKLYNAMLNAGFYDQAHFNKMYKSLIGTSPSKTYHSNIVQK